MVGLQRVFRKICVILAVGLIVYSIGNVSKKFTSEPDSTDHVDTSRKLLESPTWEGCSYELGHGHYVFLIPYAVCILLSFIGLALICDDFFVPSLEAISDKLDLSEDVAGATFMAAGSSAPELFTSVAGVGVESDVGVGTIVGSAMFNILIIVALSAVLAGKSLFLDWRPLFRDATMYGISIIFFIGFAWDGYLEWYEALTLLILYIIYIILMKFNSHLMKLLLKVECTFCKNTRLAPVQLNEESGASVNAHGSTVTAGDSTHSDHHKHRFVHSHKGELAGTISHRRRSTTSSLPLQHTQHHYQQELPILEDHSQEIKPIIPSIHISSESSPTIAEEVNQVQPSESDAKDNNGKQLPINAVQSSASQIGSIESEEDPTITLIPFLPPIKAAPPDWTEAKEGGLLGWIKYILSMTLFVVSFPFMVVFTWTIPNCSKNRKWYVVTASFLMSIFWIAALSFMMVTVVARLGCLLGVGEFTMGLVVVAIGTSIPDAISSILVARDGFGDMAVSNAIGSNVFDINLGLGLPFLLRTCIDKGKAFALLSEEQMAAYHAGEYTIIPHAKFSLVLLLVIFLVIGIFTAFRFKLNAFVGLSFVAMYVLFLTYAFIQETVCEEGKHC